MIEFFFLVLYLGLLLYAALFDLKNKWVPDKISYCLCILGFALYFARDGFSYLPFLGFWLFFFFGLGMYYTELWGGADVKILAAAGAAFGPNILYVFFLFAFSFLYGFVWWSLKRERQAPFVPVLALASIVQCIILAYYN